VCEAVLHFRDSIRNSYVVPIRDHAFACLHAAGNALGTFTNIEHVLTMAGIHVPKTARECLMNPLWRDEAMFPEFSQLEGLGAWSIIPEGEATKRPIKGKSIFTAKFDKNGNLARRKGRLVGQGFLQIPGIDFDRGHTYAPVAMPEVVRLILCISARAHHYVHHIDIGNAFIIPKLKKEIYMKIPIGMREWYASTGRTLPEGSVLKLHKALYGLVQSGYLWYHDLKGTLESFGFIEYRIPCLFTRQEKDGSWSWLVIYVDDIVASFADIAVMKELFLKIMEKRPFYKVKDLGPISWFLNIAVDYDRIHGKVSFNQRLYIEKFFARFKLNELNPQRVPMSASDAMMFARPVKWAQTYPQLAESNELCDRDEITAYRAVIGTALHATKHTRPDIITAVYFAATAMHSPTKYALLAAMKILRFAYDTRHQSLNFSMESGEVHVTGYGDSDWAGWHDGRSRVGICIKLGSPDFNTACLVWNTILKVPRMVSTPEAETSSMFECGKMMFHILAMLDFCHVPRTALGTAFCDNQPAISQCENPFKANRKRHYHVSLFKVVEYYNEDSDLRIAVIKKIASADNLSDLYTKIKYQEKEFFVLRGMNMNLPHRMIRCKK
jgi:hypothetical protein